MPGPRAKQNSGKKNKPKAVTQLAQDGTALGSPTIPLSELSNDDWDKVAKVLCEHFQLPGRSTARPSNAVERADRQLDLTTRSGLKKVYHNFSIIYKRMNDTYVANEANELVRGGIVAIYVKMCADSILRNMLFHQGKRFAHF